MFNNIYKGKKVFVTGNTGFKMSWVCKWLLIMGAEVNGYSLLPEFNPVNHFDILESLLDYDTTFGDIRDRESLKNSIKKFNPDIVIHGGAQPIVKLSYVEPAMTFETNIMGTVNVLDVCRELGTVGSVVLVMTDKVYRNQEWIWGYRENDALGGADPYSASKSCAEIVTEAYRSSFFDNNDDIYVATVRAGNVLGGGDYGHERLVPNTVRAILNKEKVILRYPNATRPWTYLIDILNGYLMVGQKLLERDRNVIGAWNFAPSDNGIISVQDLVELIDNYWEVDYEIIPDLMNHHESTLLQLDTTKARNELGWEPLYCIEDTVYDTMLWYREYHLNNKVITEKQINEYMEFAE